MVLQVMGKDSSMLCQVLVQGMSWEEIQLHKVFFFQSKWKHCGLSYSKNTNYYYKNISAETITYGRLIWNQIFWWKYLDAWNNIWCSSPILQCYLLRICVWLHVMFTVQISWVFQGARYSWCWFSWRFGKVWGCANVAKSLIRINKFLTLLMYHYLCLFLKAIQQNLFIWLKLLKRELTWPKTRTIHMVTSFRPVNYSSRGVTWNSRDHQV